MKVYKTDFNLMNLNYRISLVEDVISSDTSIVDKLEYCKTVEFIEAIYALINDEAVIKSVNSTFYVLGYSSNSNVFVQDTIEHSSMLRLVQDVKNFKTSHNIEELSPDQLKPFILKHFGIEFVEGYNRILSNPSIDVKETTSRFSGAVWYDEIQDKDITLAGVGGIGSFVAFLLSRVNPKSLTLYDNDTVELGNLSGQLFGKRNIGMDKVEAIATMIADYSDYYRVNCINSRYTTGDYGTDIMICGFDNMSARKIYFAKWLEHLKEHPDRSKCLYIDGRLALEEFQVFCITGDDTDSINRYKSTLFSDDEADETVCSIKQTSFMSNLIGSIITNLFVNFCANKCDVLIERDLPYYTYYNASTMYFKTER